MWKRLAHSGAWAALDSLSAAMLAFSFFIVTARLLTPEQFGIAMLALSVAQIAQPLIDSLFHDAIVQKERITPADVTTATTFCLVWSGFLALMLWLLAPAIAAVLSVPELAFYLPPLGIALVSSGASAIASALARREMRFRVLAVRTVCARVIGLSVGVWMAWTGYGVWAVIAQFVLSALLSALFLLATAGLPLGRVHLVQLKSLFAFALPSVGSQFLLFATPRTITLAIGGFLGAEAAGSWGVAFRFVEPLQIVFATTIGQISLPVFSRQQGNRGEIGRYFLVGTHLMAVLFVPLFLGLAFCAPEIIQILVGPKWLDVAPIMQVVCIGTLLLLLRQMAEIALTSIGRPHYTFYTHTLASLLSLLGVFALVFFGLLPAAFGWALRVVPFFTLNAAFVRQELKLAVPVQVAVTATPLVAGLVMCVALFWLEKSLLATWVPAHRLPILIASGVVVYSATLLALDTRVRRLLSEIRWGKPPFADL